MQDGEAGGGSRGGGRVALGRGFRCYQDWLWTYPHPMASDPLLSRTPLCTRAAEHTIVPPQVCHTPLAAAQANCLGPPRTADVYHLAIGGPVAPCDNCRVSGGPSELCGLTACEACLPRVCEDECACVRTSTALQRWRNAVFPSLRGSAGNDSRRQGKRQSDVSPRLRQGSVSTRPIGKAALWGFRPRGSNGGERSHRKKSVNGMRVVMSPCHA